MSLPVFQATIVNDSGDVIPSPVITVLIESTGLPATLFSDRNGTVPLGTGGVFSGEPDGFAQFYADPTEYRVTASDAGSGFSQTWRFVVLIGTAALADTQTSPTDTTAGALMEVGAFGNGKGGFNVALDVNTLIVPAKYFAGTGSNNLPSGVLTGLMDVTSGTVATANDRIVQRLHDYTNIASYERTSLNLGGTWSAWQPVYTGVNYQPEVVNGIGVVRKMKNNSGGSISTGATVSGTLLRSYFVDASGDFIDTGSTGGSGTTWINSSGSNTGNGNGVDFTRVS
jgi:hypothetical protein